MGPRLLARRTWCARNKRLCRYKNRVVSRGGCKLKVPVPVRRLSIHFNHIALLAPSTSFPTNLNQPSRRRSSSSSPGLPKISANCPPGPTSPARHPITTTPPRRLDQSPSLGSVLRRAILVYKVLLNHLFRATHAEQHVQRTVVPRLLHLPSQFTIPGHVSYCIPGCDGGITPSTCLFGVSVSRGGGQSCFWDEWGCAFRGGCDATCVCDVDAREWGAECDAGWVCAEDKSCQGDLGD